MPRTDVVSQEKIADGLYRMVIKSPVDLSQSAYMPGQFLHFRVSDSIDFMLRRPISLCLADEANNLVTVVYRAQGEGTKRLARLTAGDTVDVIGPLGKGFPLHEESSATLVIGGGIGVPPLLELAKKLRAKGTRVVAILGFQKASQAILIEEFKALAEVFIVTDDGSMGKKGLVTDLLDASMTDGISRYYACGPTPMLRAVKETLEPSGILGYLSLEERMGCGIGLCAGCVHKIQDNDGVHYVKTCKEGPVFAAEEVVFS